MDTDKFKMENLKKLREAKNRSITRNNFSL